MNSDGTSSLKLHQRGPDPKFFFLSRSDYFLRLGLVFYVSFFVAIIMLFYLSSMGLVHIEKRTGLMESVMELFFWFAMTGLPTGLLLTCMVKYNLRQIDVIDGFLIIYVMKPPLAYLPFDQSKTKLCAKEIKEVSFRDIKSATCRKGRNSLEFTIHLENESINFKLNDKSWGFTGILENEGIWVEKL